MGEQSWPPPPTPDPDAWEREDATEPIAVTQPIAQHRKQSTAYSVPAAIFWLLTGAVGGALGVAAVAAHSWGAW